jgi:hypothetical protein
MVSSRAVCSALHGVHTRETRRAYFCFEIAWHTPRNGDGSMRKLALVLASVLVAGCADSATRPASWPTLVGAQRARFATTASPGVVRANACALTGKFKDGERTRNWTVSFGERACWSRPDADSIPLYVYMTNDHRAVVLEAIADDVPEETLRAAVTSTGLSLKDAVKRTQEAPPATHDKGGNGGTIAAAAVAGGVTVGVVVGVVIAVVGVMIGGVVALIGAFGKALR